MAHVSSFHFTFCHNSYSEELRESTDKKLHDTTAWKLLEDQRGLQGRAQYELLQKLLVDGTRGKYIYDKTDQNIERLERKNHQQAKRYPGNPNCERHRPSHQRGTWFHPGAGHLPSREVFRGLSFSVVFVSVASKSWVTLAPDNQEKLPC